MPFIVPPRPASYRRNPVMDAINGKPAPAQPAAEKNPPKPVRAKAGKPKKGKKP